MVLFVHGVAANAGATCLKEHQKTAMDRVNAGDDLCTVFQEQLDCFKNVQQCKGMLPVVKQAAQQGGDKQCSFKCGGNSESPSRLRSTSKSTEVATCRTDVQKKTTEVIQDATGDTEKSKKLFEEDFCDLYQEQLNCYGDDEAACEAVLPDLEKATTQATAAMKSVYNVKKCQFKCDGSSGLEDSNGVGAVRPLFL